MANQNLKIINADFVSVNEELILNSPALISGINDLCVAGTLSVDNIQEKTLNSGVILDNVALFRQDGTNTNIHWGDTDPPVNTNNINHIYRADRDITVWMNSDINGLTPNDSPVFLMSRDSQGELFILCLNVAGNMEFIASSIAATPDPDMVFSVQGVHIVSGSTTTPPTISSSLESLRLSGSTGNCQVSEILEVNTISELSANHGVVINSPLSINSDISPSVSANVCVDLLIEKEGDCVMVLASDTDIVGDEVPVIWLSRDQDTQHFVMGYGSNGTFVFSNYVSGGGDIGDMLFRTGGLAARNPGERPTVTNQASNCMIMRGVNQNVVISEVLETDNIIEVLGSGNGVMIQGVLVDDNSILFDGTQSPLSHYEELTHTSNISGLWASDIVDVAFNLVRIGTVVTMNLKIPAVSVATLSSTISLISMIPAQFRPSVVTTSWASVSDNTVSNLGSVTISTGGNCTFASDSLGSVFSGSGNSGLLPGSWQWVI